MNRPDSHVASWRSLTPRQASLVLILVSGLLHLLVAGRVELSADEAHYALYGVFLDWSYFDHPPLAGWFMALMLTLGESEFVLRLLPVLMFVAISLVIYQLAEELFPDENPWLGFASVAVLQSGILFHILALAMIPDTPLLLFGLLAVLFLWRAWREEKLRYWIVIGICFGLAGLSKYTAITLVLTALLFVHFSNYWRVVRQPGPWLALLLALLSIMPVLYWNAANDWISFRYQLGHGFHKPDWSIFRFGITQAGQFLVYSPGIYLFGLIALLAALRDWAHPGSRLILFLTVPVLLLFNWGAGYEESLPHWTSLAWAGLSPLTARWLIRNWNRTWIKVLGGFSGLYSVALILLLHSLLFYPWLKLEPDTNILRDLYGWQEAGVKAAELRRQMAITPGPEPLLMVDNWSLASRLAWYSRPTPVIVNDTRKDQFDLWFGEPQLGNRGIMVMPSYFKHPEKLTKTGFESCTRIDELPVSRNNHVQVTYYFYACYNFQGQVSTSR